MSIGRIEPIGLRLRMQDSPGPEEVGCRNSKEIAEADFLRYQRRRGWIQNLWALASIHTPIKFHRA
jgi:hypothetical protein